MKFIKYFAATLCFATVTMSCVHKFEDYNTNQNNMELWKIGPLGMLEDVLFYGADGSLSRTWQFNGELIQYTVQLYAENVHRYQIRESYAAWTWNHYAKWATNAHHMLKLAEMKEDDNCRAIALTMRALYMADLTCLFGSVPFSEAFMGMTFDENMNAVQGNTKPKFDSQQEVFTQLLADLELANSLYVLSTPLSDPKKDLMYGGSIDKWQRFTNTLQMRMLMRLSNRDKEMGISTKMTEMVNNPSKYPLMRDNGDNATLFYTNVFPFVNRFGSTTHQNFTSNARKMAEFIVNTMDKVADPRLGIYAIQRNNQWAGIPSGCPSSEMDAGTCAELNKAVLGDYTSPYSFMRYDELLFILAEAAQKGMIPGGDAAAKGYYESAILASFEHWDAINPGTNRITQLQKDQYLVKVAYNGSQEQLALQKYIALFWCGFEAYHDYRRTGFPVLKAGTGTSNDGVLPTRFIYPIVTVETNYDNYKNAIATMGADNMKTPLWWSKKAVAK